LCGIQCTEQEICSVLGVTDKTLNSWCNREYGENFSEVFNKKREMGKSSLRRNQWKMAENNVTMAIWLGKQYLGQSEKIDANVKDDKREEMTEFLEMVKNGKLTKR
jgi:hypothetical protein